MLTIRPSRFGGGSGSSGADAQHLAGFGCAADVFVPVGQSKGYVNFVVIKTPDSTPDAARLIKDAVASVDANQGVFFVQSLPQLIADSVAVRRFLFTLLTFFGGAALLLSAFGIYGLISFVAVEPDSRSGHSHGTRRHPETDCGTGGVARDSPDVAWRGCRSAGFGDGGEAAFRDALRCAPTGCGDASANCFHPRSRNDNRSTHPCVAKFSRGADARAQDRVAAG